ncbi:cytochrome P450 [Thamnidium elegans]|nr:cytochrome P450 [Thamnidium elegans]
MSYLKNTFLQQPLNNAVEIYNSKVVPHLIKKNKTIAISVAVAISIFYIIRDQVFRPPRNLRHIPYFGYFSILGSILKNESLFDRGKRVSMEFVKSRPDGLYLEPGKVGWEIQVYNAEDIKHILLKYGQPNLVFTNGEEWKSQKKVINPAFRRSMPVKLFGNITQQLFKRIEGSEKTLDVSDLMTRCTLEAIGKAGFEFDFEAVSKEDSKWTKIYNEVIDGFRDFTYFMFPRLDQELLWLFPKRKVLHQKLDTLMDMLDEVIQNKRELLKQGQVRNDDLEENERDLLTLMLESEELDEGSLSDKHNFIIINHSILFFSKKKKKKKIGHDTTASALSFALNYLAKYPKIQERARKEANLILGDRPEDIISTVEETKQMIYINQIIKETLRLKAPVPRITPRLVTKDTFLSGTFIPKGSRVTINIYDLHLSDKAWENPTEFDPDRFAQEESNSTWAPFGGGARQCIGMNFSLNEQRVMIAMILRKYTLSLPNNSTGPDDVCTAGIPVVVPHELYITFNKRY